MSWIPVNERLPPIDSFIIATDGKEIDVGHAHYQDSTEGFEEDRNQWIFHSFFEYPEFQWDEFDKITHWQPLPKPPGKDAATIKDALDNTDWLYIRLCDKCLSERPSDARFVIRLTDGGVFYAACPVCGDRLSD